MSGLKVNGIIKINVDVKLKDKGKNKIMKYEAKPPVEPKTRTRIVIEAFIWIVSAIISITYVFLRAYSSIAFLFVIIFWMTMFGFYIYDDTRRRYLKSTWNVGWAVAIGIFPLLFFLYNLIRPPITLEATGTQFHKKLIFSFIVTAAFITFLILINTLINSSSNKPGYQKIKSEAIKAISNMNNLSQEEQVRFIELRNRVEQIIYNHIEEQDRVIYTNLQNEEPSADANIAVDTMHILLQKVNSKLTQEERMTIIEFQKLRAKLTASGSH